MKVLLILATSLITIATSAPRPSVKWIDLTYQLHNTTIHWPGNFGVESYGFKLVPLQVIDNQMMYFKTNNILMMEHIGTHMDAPSHYYKGAADIHQIALEKVIGYAVVVNMTEKAAKNPDAQLMISDVEVWEREHGRVPDDSVFLVNSGWGRFWGNAPKYFGGDGKNVSNFHFPGIHVDTAKWLVENRKIKMYGIDVISIDFGPALSRYGRYPVHTYFGKKGIPTLENVAHLDKLPPTGALVFAAPLNVKYGSGAGVRLIATLSNLQKPQASGGMITGAQVAIVSLMTALVLGLASFE